MSLPSANETPWSLFEWVASGVATFVASVATFVWRLLRRIDRLEAAINQQRLDFDNAGRASETGATRLDQVQADHYRLRATIGALPTRNDLRDVEDHINERIDSIVARLDRALETRGN